MPTIRSFFRRLSRTTCTLARRQLALTSLFGLCAGSQLGCASPPPLSTVERVDIPRFMGDWYVIGNIPTFLEKGAYNPVESYALRSDGAIATTFSFNEDSFSGERKVYHATGFIEDEESKALWGMQFIWPFKGEYKIIYLAPDYSTTVIGRTKRDYVWIMARAPKMSEEEFGRIVKFLQEVGYDTAQIERPPQQAVGEREQTPPRGK